VQAKDRKTIKVPPLPKQEEERKGGGVKKEEYQGKE